MNRHFFKLFFGTLFLFATAAFTGCTDNDKPGGAPELTADPTTLSFTGVEESKDVTITSNCEWKVKTSNLDWATITPKSGSGNGKITVSVGELATGTQTGTITFELIHPEYGPWGDAESKVTVTQSAGDVPTPPQGDPIYEENCGTSVSKVNDRWPYVDAFEGWQRGGSLDQSGVTYGGKSSSVRNSGAAYDPEPADEISGPPYVTVKTFDIEHVNIESKTNFTFTFVAQNTVETLDVEPYTPTFGDITATSFKFSVSMDGTKFSPVQFTAEKTASSWYKCKAEFKLPAGATTSELTLRMDGFTGGTTLRVDDFKLYEGGNGAELGEGDDPIVGEMTAITIPELVDMAKGAKNKVIDATADRYIDAVVMNNFEGGNHTYNNLILATEGATQAKNGITCAFVIPGEDLGLTTTHEKIRLKLLKGVAQVTDYNGLLEITGPKDTPYCEVIEHYGTVTVTPVKIDASALADYQGMAVTIENASTAADAVWGNDTGLTKHTFSQKGTDFTVFVKKGPTVFTDQLLKAGTGTITGLASVNSNTAQLVPRDLNDVTDFIGQPSTDPVITSVTPASLTFAAVDEAKTVIVTTANAEDCMIEAVSSNDTQFSVMVNNNTQVVTVTPSENTTTAEITATLTIKLMKAGAAVDTRTVAIKQGVKPAGDTFVVTVTKEDILAATESSYADFSFDNTFGTWTGKGAIKHSQKSDGVEVGPFIQINFNNNDTKSAFNSRIITPELGGTAVSVEVVLAPNTFAPRGVGIYASDYAYAVGTTESDFEAAALVLSDQLTEKGGGTVTVDLTGKNLTKFAIFPYGGAIYINSIKITCTK